MKIGGISFFATQAVLRAALLLLLGRVVPCFKASAPSVMEAKATNVGKSGCRTMGLPTKSGAFSGLLFAVQSVT